MDFPGVISILSYWVQCGLLASSFGAAMIRSAVAGNEVLQPLIMRQVYFALLGIVLIFWSPQWIMVTG